MMLHVFCYCSGLLDKLSVLVDHLVGSIVRLDKYLHHPCFHQKVVVGQIHYGRKILHHIAL